MSWINWMSKECAVVFLGGVEEKKERGIGPPKEKYNNINYSYPLASYSIWI